MYVKHTHVFNLRKQFTSYSGPGLQIKLYLLKTATLFECRDTGINIFLQKWLAWNYRDEFLNFLASRQSGPAMSTRGDVLADVERGSEGGRARLRIG